LGFKDVISIEKSGEHFRLLYDVKGRFTIHRITPEEASYKLLKVRKVALGARGVPHIVTHDGRTIRYPDPVIKVNDTVKFDFETGKITDFVKFDTGNIVMITGGRNMGRAGVIVHREKHIGGFDIVHVKDTLDKTFATRYVVMRGSIFTLVSNIALVSPTSSSSVRAPSPGSPSPRARVPSLPSPRSVMSGESVPLPSKCSTSSTLHPCMRMILPVCTVTDSPYPCQKHRITSPFGQVRKAKGS
jgi:hypothetical protein